MTEGTPETRRGRMEHWMPGIHALRTYEQSWLSRDLIATIDRGRLYPSVT